MPTQQIASSMRLPVLTHKSVGAYQYRSQPSAFATTSRYMPAGRMPFGPMSPRIWNASEKKTEK
jgi:hypothetical protein